MDREKKMHEERSPSFEQLEPRVMLSAADASSGSDAGWPDIPPPFVGPDLRISNIQLYPPGSGPYVPGQEVSGQAYIEELGGDWVVDVFHYEGRLSTNQVWGDADDIVCYNDYEDEGLDPWEAYTDYGFGTVPPGTPPGFYYLAVMIDSTNVVSESNESNNIAWLGPAGVVVAPFPPTSVSATDGTHTDRVRVTWNASAGATGYEVWRGTSSDPRWATRIEADHPTTTYDDTTATAGTTYYYWVAANSNGITGDVGISDWGWRAIAPPSPPTGVSASDGAHADKVRVTWDAPNGATAYEVWRSTSASSSTATLIRDNYTITTYDDTTATPGTTYHYWVKAKNVGGTSTFSSSNSGWRAVSPPTGVWATDGAYTDKVRISWNPSAGATDYEVWRGASSDSSTATRIAANQAGTTYDDTTTTAGTAWPTYHYWVKANSAQGTSGFSFGDWGWRAVPIPATPTGVAASDGTYTDKVRITWNLSAEATAYEVWRSTSEDSWTATQIEASHPGTTYDDTTATPGTTYYYWVKAKNVAGTSAIGSRDSGWRQVPPPSPPTGVLASNGTYTDKVRIAWDASAGADTYEVWRDTSTDSSTATRIEANHTGTTYDDTTATPGTTYYYWVKATSGAGTSGFSSSNSGSRTVSVPDLSISGLQGVAGTYVPGQTVSGSAYIANLGTQDVTETFYFEGHLSTNQVWGDADDVVCYNAYEDEGVDAGEGYWDSDIGAVPWGMPPGSYYVAVQIDSTDVVDNELDENNNIVWTPTANVVVEDAAGSQPDLTITNLQGVAGTYAPGDTVSGEARIANLGTQDVIETFDFEGHLSTNQVWGDADDIVCYNAFEDEGVDAGEDYWDTDFGAVPLGTAPGCYHLAVQIDSTDVVDNESNETNNVVWTPTASIVVEGVLGQQAPVVVTPLPDYPQHGFAFGEKLTVGVDAFDADGDPVTISVQTNQPNLIAHVPTGNSFARLTFVQEDGVTPVLGDGTVVLGLLDDQAPLAVERFKTLAQNEVLGDGTLDPNGTPFYTDVTVHRVITDFMLQTGDGENHDGSGGSQLGPFQNETRTGRTFVGAGTVGLANSGANTNNAQFFIMQGDTGDADNSRWPWLNNFHTICAQVISGQVVVDTMADTDLYPRDPISNRPDHPPLLDSVEIFESDQLGTITFESINGWVGITDVTVTLSDGTGQQTQYTFTVNVSGADAYEGDDTLDDADTFYRRITTDGVPQVHSLHSVGASADEDWAYFDVVEDSVVTIETNGPAGGDTVLEIVRPSDGAWASDDDGGDGLYSRMEFYLPAETYFVRVYESGGDQTLFGYTLSVKMIPADEPDLVVSDTAPEVIHALPGEVVTVAVTTLNDSGAAAAPTGAGQFDTILFLRTDRNFALADVGDIVAVQSFTYLYAGQFVQHTHTFNAPSQVGTYYLSALADAYDTVWEPVDQYGQEAPNDWGPIITLVVDQPFVDLSIDFTAATTLPAAAVSGDGTPIWTQVLVANRGNVPPDQNQTVDIEIYAREVNSQAETLIDTWDNMWVGLLGAGQGGTAQRNVYLPPGLPDGDYELVARLADTGSLQDTDPSNDFDDTTGVMDVTRGFVDITAVLGDITVPGAVVEGQLFSGLVPVTVHNGGNVPLPAGQQVDVTIVADPTAGGDPDVQIAAAPGQSVGSLAAGGSQTVWVYVSHAAGLPAGTYDLRADVVPTQALNEEDANNNSATVDGQGQTPQIVSAPAFVDLAADFSPWMTLPAAATSGDGTAISASVVVTNNGNVMTDPGQTGDVEIYARVAGTQNDTLIATLNDQSLAWIGAGQSRTLSGVVYLPPGLATGQYVLRAELTDLGALQDPNLLDNAVDTAGQIAVTRGFVDITSTFGTVTLPGAVVADQPFSGLVPVTVHNTGNVPLPVGQQVDVTVVGDPTVGAGADVPLAQMPGQWVGGLAGGGSQTLWMWVSVPGGLAAETYDLRADIVPTQALNEEDANNNSATVDGQGQTPQIVSAPAFVDLAAGFSPWMQLPAAATSGDGTAVFASVVVTNNGNVMTEPAQTGDVEIYARVAGTQNDTLIATLNDQSLAWIAPGASRTLSGVVYLPPGLATGQYVLRAEVTDLGALNDPNLADNAVDTAGQIAVTRGFVDITSTFGTVTLPGAVVADQPFSGLVPVTIHNTGNVPLPIGQQVDVTVVGDPTIGAGADVPLAQMPGQWVGGLAGGGSQTLWMWVSVPGGLPAETYDLRADIVPTQALNEEDANNNSATVDGQGQTPQIVSAPAFVDPAVGFSPWMQLPAAAVSGDGTAIFASVVVTNNGNVMTEPAQTGDVEIYAREAGTQNDTLIATLNDQSLAWIAPGASRTLSGVVYLPPGLATGQYVLAAEVTDLGALQDPNLLDNTAETAGQIAVTEGFVDLAMGITSTGFRGGEIGGDTRWAVLSVTNVGNVRAWGGAQVQLRTVPNGGGQAVDLGQPASVQLWLPANGGMQPAYVPYTLPLDIATGPYDLQAEIVGLTDLTDNNAANDAAADTGPGGAGYPIQQALLDLAAAFSWIGVPDPAATDTPYGTYVIVHHLGNRTFQSVVDVEVYVSADNQLDGGDERIGLLEDVTGYFGVGGAGYFWVPVVIPPAVVAGDYFLIANVIQKAPANAALDPLANNGSATPGTTAVA